MKHTLLIGLVLAISLRAVTAADSDAKIIQGNWKPVTGELSGHPMAETVLQTISMKLEKGKYEVIADGRPDRGTYTLDGSTKPKGMTVTGTEGPNQGKAFPCIYELEGDTLRICYDLSGAKRPTEFKSLPNTKLYLVTYARKKE
jgi:uncharacterized protein (TIGR03067 family)